MRVGRECILLWRQVYLQLPRYERAPTRGRPKVTGSWGNRWQTRRLNSLNNQRHCEL